MPLPEVADELREVGGGLVDDRHDVRSHALGLLTKGFLQERAGEAAVGVGVHVFDLGLVGVEDEGAPVSVPLYVHQAAELLLHARGV